MEKLSSEQSETSDRVLEFDLSAELRHGIAVSNLAYALSQELGLPHEQCYDLAIAGMLHDIGKLKLRSYINGQESRVCDVFCALSQDRSYRKAFDKHTVMELMIDEIKNFDLEVFLAFQRVVHASQAGK